MSIGNTSPNREPDQAAHALRDLGHEGQADALIRAPLKLGCLHDEFEVACLQPGHTLAGTAQARGSMQAQVRLTLWAAVAGHDSLNGPRPPQATERTARAASVHRCASQQAKHLLAYSPYGMMLLHLLEQVYGSLLIACGLQSCTACRHEQAAVRFWARHRVDVSLANMARSSTVVATQHLCAPGTLPRCLDAWLS